MNRRIIATTLGVTALVTAAFLAGSLLGSDSNPRGAGAGQEAATATGAIVSEEDEVLEAANNDNPSPPVNGPQTDGPPNSNDAGDEQEAAETPVVLSISPEPGSTGVEQSTMIVLTFSESMDRASTQKGFGIETTPLVLALGQPTLKWNEDDTQLTFTPAAPLPYGTDVAISVEGTAKSAAGAPLGEDFSSSFRIVRETTLKLAGMGSHDGHVFAPPVLVQGSHAVTQGDIHVGTWSRGFLSFSLDKLPSDLIQITGAELSVFQKSAHEDAYTNQTGALSVHRKFYGSLDAGDFSDPAGNLLIAIIPTILSDSAATGWKTADVLGMVQQDWGQRAEQNFLSQFRLRFDKENAGAGPSISATFLSGDAASRIPVLTVTFEHP